MSNHALVSFQWDELQPLIELGDNITDSVNFDTSARFEDIAPLDISTATQLSFYTNKSYEDNIIQSKCDTIITSQPLYESLPDSLRNAKAYIITKHPYWAMAKLSHFFEKAQTQAQSGKIGRETPLNDFHKTSIIHPSALETLSSCTGVKIGEYTKISAGVIIEDNVSIGSCVTIEPNAVLLKNTVIGDNVIIKPGAIIGSAGFGVVPAYQTPNNKNYPVPQRGNVIIEEGVSVGANTTIDRAAFGSTRIGAYTKLDNLVQIAHNVNLGANILIASQSGVAGSSSLGEGCIIGAQAGVVGHLNIANNTVLSARAGVAKNITMPYQTYSGFPAFLHKDWLKVKAFIRRQSKQRKR